MYDSMVSLCFGAGAGAGALRKPASVAICGAGALTGDGAAAGDGGVGAGAELGTPSLEVCPDGAGRCAQPAAIRTAVSPTPNTAARARFPPRSIIAASPTRQE